jgi:hypothetical protein
MSEMVEMALEVFERKILSSINGPIQETAEWRMRYSEGIYGLCKDIDVVTYTELTGLGIR